jgi:hypothetical protein
VSVLSVQLNILIYNDLGLSFNLDKSRCFAVGSGGKHILPKLTIIGDQTLSMLVYFLFVDLIETMVLAV